jgi:hypothetical protein
VGKTAFILVTAWLAVCAGCADRQEPADLADDQARAALAEEREEAPPVEEDPALTKGKRASEAAAHASLRVLATAQAQFRSSQGGGYGTLEELGEQDLIIMELAAASTPDRARNGYYYKMTPDKLSWSCAALPVQPGISGDYSYYIDQSGTVRRAPCAIAEDRPAGPESLPLN